jgi:hypothetical protein
MLQAPSAPRLKASPLSGDQSWVRGSKPVAVKRGATAKTPLAWQRWPNVALVILSLAVLSTGGSEVSQDTSAIPATSAGELAKEKHNPFADQITLPLQLSSSLDVGPGNGTAGGVNAQPAIPVSVGQDWLLIARPSLSLLASEPPDRKLGLGDIELQTYLTPKRLQTWIWGIGPVLQAPTATETVLGNGKWCAGPGLGLVYMKGPWVNGILANHIWSFAGDRDRAAVSQSTFEPVLSYNFDSGWFLSFDSSMTADWNAPADKRWTIPLGLDVGKAFQLGRQSVSLQFGTYYNVERAEGAARWLVRLQLSFIFPKHAAHQNSDAPGT